jgi:tRNA-dihydrouridine synthase
MQGVGAPTIRDVVSELGAPGMICAPFVRVTAHKPNLALIQEQLHRSSDIPLSAQVLGSHPDNLALAARALAEAGADVVDLNLGCPTRLAGRKGVGAALLSHWDSIARIVEHMRTACGCTLSVKIRTSEGDADNVIRLAQVIEGAGADLLIVHPRTRQQGYAGLADWSIVKRLKAVLRIPVVGNGDLWYATDALRLMRESGADAIMLGRPALRNPYIFRQISDLCHGVPPYEPTGADVYRYIAHMTERARVDLARRQRGPAGAVKEQVQFVLRVVPEPLRSTLWQRSMHAMDLDAILSALEPLRDAPVLDIAAGGPLRFEATPATPV